MCIIAPHVRRRCGGDRCRLRTQFRREGEGIGLQRLKPAIRAVDGKFVAATGPDIGQENLPDPDIAAAAHDVAFGVPVVEVADHGHTPGIRRPHGEVNPGRALMLDQMRAHLVIKAKVRSLGDQIIVGRPQDRAETVGIGHPPFGAIALRLVSHRLRRTGDDALEEIVGADPGQRAERKAC